MKTKYLSLYKLMGKGYTRGYWRNCHTRYRAFKGARNTKKSWDICGFEIIDKIVSDERRNIVVVRQTFNTHRHSTYPRLKKIINIMGMKDYFDWKDSEMIITYKATGQVILFKGFDNPEKLTSIEVEFGYLTDVYVEEAFEINDYEAWRIFDGSIRGKLPDGLFHQITFCFNAWNIDHWIYEKLFKGRLEDDLQYLLTHTYQDYKNEEEIIDGGYGKGVYLHISTYKINEFRDIETYDVVMEELRKRAPEIYKVEALGMWGNATESTYPEFTEDLIKSRADINNAAYNCYSIGIDTGLSNGEGKIKHGKDVRIRSATTMQMVGITSDFNRLNCINEFFYSNENEIVKKTEPQLMEDIVDTLIEWKKLYQNHPVLMKGIIPVYVDCADIGFRQGLELVAKKKGLFNVQFMGSTKIRIQTRVDFIRLLMAWGEFQMSEACSNLIREIRNSRKGEKGEVREDFDDHAINSNEYAWYPIINRLRRWKDFKQH